MKRQNGMLLPDIKLPGGRTLMTGHYRATFPRGQAPWFLIAPTGGARGFCVVVGERGFYAAVRHA